MSCLHQQVYVWKYHMQLWITSDLIVVLQGITKKKRERMILDKNTQVSISLYNDCSKGQVDVPFQQ